MKIRICHSKCGVLFDGNVAKVETIEQDEEIIYVVTDWDGTEREIVSRNEYTVLRIGDKEKAQKKHFLQPTQTTWDIASDFKRAIKTLKEANVDTDKLYFYLPTPDGWMKQYGPCTAEEARQKCMEYWDKKGGPKDAKTD